MTDSQLQCQETIDWDGKDYVRCGAPAVGVVQHRGRREGPYAMCFGCLDHNVRNRDAWVVSWLNDKARATYEAISGV